MNPFEKLTSLFSEFPGIGPRQAKRFVYFLTSRPQTYLQEFTSLIERIQKEVHTCKKCFRLFLSPHNDTAICNICDSSDRDHSLLMIVSRDADFEHIEKIKTYNGLYFILGGTLPILEQTPEKKIRIKELVEIIKNKINERPLLLKEIIIAVNANPEGEHTAEFVKKALIPYTTPHAITISMLGRGLSTGTELEYSDNDTLSNALKNRK